MGGMRAAMDTLNITAGVSFTTASSNIGKAATLKDTEAVRSAIRAADKGKFTPVAEGRDRALPIWAAEARGMGQQAMVAGTRRVTEAEASAASGGKEFWGRLTAAPVLSV